MSDSANDKAFLTFSLGPVQTFIASARTVRDLWTGSYLLSWLTFNAMKAVLDEQRCGKDSLIFPALDLHPLLRWERGHVFADHELDKLLSPCLPNRFLAEVPEDLADELAYECKTACRNAWKEIADVTFQRLEKEIGVRLPKYASDWSVDLWDQQVQSFFDVQTVVMKHSEFGPDILRSLLNTEREPHSAASRDNSPDKLWKDRWRVMQKLFAAQRSERHVPAYVGQFVRDDLANDKEKVGAKCTLLGSYEQMGPVDFGRSKEFWRLFADGEKGIGVGAARTRARERLCAVSLIKRFGWFASLKETLNVLKDHRSSKYPDTATVAAAKWLEKSDKVSDEQLDPEQCYKKYSKWSGQWLHWPSPNHDKEEDEVPQDIWDTIDRKRRTCGPPPAYYAILMLDGDKIGELLKHSDRQRQQNISRCLAQFALEKARRIVEDRLGVLIYSGGDDVLAMMPTSEALACAQELNQGFRDLWTKMVPPDGNDPPTVSAGIAVMHYKEDLRFALDAARSAEKKAKNSGRDCLTLTICRRSGEHTHVTMPWSFAKDTMPTFVSAFTDQASDRWVYHLMADRETLRGLPCPDGPKLEIVRQLKRSDSETRGKLPADVVLKAFRNYCDFRQETNRWPDEPAFYRLTEAEQQQELGSRAFVDFVTLCQSASFLARGRD